MSATYPAIGEEYFYRMEGHHLDSTSSQFGLTSPPNVSEDLWADHHDRLVIKPFWFSIPESTSASNWQESMEHHQYFKEEEGYGENGDCFDSPTGDELPPTKSQQHPQSVSRMRPDIGICTESLEPLQQRAQQSVATTADETNHWPDTFHPATVHNPAIESFAPEYGDCLWKTILGRPASSFDCDDLILESQEKSVSEGTNLALRIDHSMLRVLPTDTSPSSTYSGLSSTEGRPPGWTTEQGSSEVLTGKKPIYGPLTWNSGWCNMRYPTNQPLLSGNTALETIDPTPFDASLMELAFSGESECGSLSTVSPSILSVMPEPGETAAGRQQMIAEQDLSLSVDLWHSPELSSFSVISGQLPSPSTTASQPTELPQLDSASSSSTWINPSSQHGTSTERQNDLKNRRSRKATHGEFASARSLPRLHPRPSTDEAGQTPPADDPRSTPGKIGKRASKATTPLAERRSSPQDIFLVQSRLAGVSYKEIQRLGNFSEAESTLRGRFRTLTKRKELRVRRPEWEAEDIRLLNEGVRVLVSSTSACGSFSSKSHAPAKIPWKRVASYIAKNGGSYHFGNATCRKKWDEIHGTER